MVSFYTTVRQMAETSQQKKTRSQHHFHQMFLLHSINTMKYWIQFTCNHNVDARNWCKCSIHKTNRASTYKYTFHKYTKHFWKL